MIGADFNEMSALSPAKMPTPKPSERLRLDTPLGGGIADGAAHVAPFAVDQGVGVIYPLLYR